MKLITIATVLFLLLAVGCKKDNSDPLPPATHTGDFTFGCKLDGKVYATSGNIRSLLSDGFVYYSYSPSFGDSTIYIDAKNTFSPKFEFLLNIHSFDSVGTYFLKTFPSQGIFINNSIRDTTGLEDTYRTIENNTGSITITYYEKANIPFYGGNILAGTFQMDAVNGEGKVIHITDGRFDIGP